MLFAAVSVGNLLSLSAGAQGLRVSRVAPENIENWYRFFSGPAFGQWMASRNDVQAAAQIGLATAEFARLRVLAANAAPEFTQLQADGRRVASSRIAQAQFDMQRIRLTLTHMNKIADELDASGWSRVKRFVLELTPDARSPVITGTN